MCKGIEVPRVDYDKLSGDRLGESSAIIRQRQLGRFAGINIVCNADMRVAEVRKFCLVQKPGLPQARQNRRQPGPRGDEPDEFIGKSLSPHLEIGADNCRFGGE
jgi:hypothetical protein